DGAAPAGFRAPTSRIDDARGGRRPHGAVAFDGETFAGTCHEQTFRLDRNGPRPGRILRRHEVEPMTSPGESKGGRALAALSELARGSVHPPTHAELDGGLRTLRAQMEAKRARRRGWTIRAAFAGTVVAAAFLAVGVVRTGRSPVPAAPPALAYRIEGGN